MFNLNFELILYKQFDLYKKILSKNLFLPGNYLHNLIRRLERGRKEKKSEKRKRELIIPVIKDQQL